MAEDASSGPSSSARSWSIDALAPLRRDCFRVAVLYGLAGGGSVPGEMEALLGREATGLSSAVSGEVVGDTF